MHDSKLDDILDNTALGVWADSAYRSAEIEAALKKLEEPDPSQSQPQQAAERAREARQQDPFVRSGPRRACFRGPGNDMGGTLLRSVGLARAKARIGLKNLAYNMRRRSNWTASPRRCDNTPSRRSPGHGPEIVQLERGKLPEIPVPAWPQTATARLTNHPLSNREFLEVPSRQTAHGACSSHLSVLDAKAACRCPTGCLRWSQEIGQLVKVYSTG